MIIYLVLKSRTGLKCRERECLSCLKCFFSGEALNVQSLSKLCLRILSLQITSASQCGPSPVFLFRCDLPQTLKTKCCCCELFNIYWKPNRAMKADLSFSFSSLAFFSLQDVF